LSRAGRHYPAERKNMFAMSGEYCNYYKVENGREMCGFRQEGIPQDCPNCPAFKKHPYDSTKDVFRVLEYYKLNNRGKISFGISKNHAGKLYFTKACIEALDRPEYVIFRMNQSNTKLEMSACEEGRQNAVKVRYLKSRIFEICSAVLARQILPYGSCGAGRIETSSAGSVIVFELQDGARQTVKQAGEVRET